MDAFERIATLLTRTTPAPVLGIAIAVSLLLFLPPGIIQTLGVEGFREENRGLIGWTFIFSYSYLWVLAALGTWGHFRKTALKRKNLQLRQRQLHKLTRGEKEILMWFMSGETTVHRAVDDGVIGGLHASKIVYRSSNMFDFVDGVPYNLQPWAREYLEKHPEIFGEFFGADYET